MYRRITKTIAVACLLLGVASGVICGYGATQADTLALNGASGKEVDTAWETVAYTATTIAMSSTVQKPTEQVSGGELIIEL